MPRVLSTLTAGLAVLLLTAGIAVAVGSGPGDPPPRTAFLANGINPADALAAGSIAGQLGAPVFTTRPDVLEDAARDGLVAYAPDLLVVLGGPIAISDDVVAAVADATGLPVRDDGGVGTDGGIVRVAGDDRYATAAEVAGLRDALNPAFLPIAATANEAVVAGTVEGRIPVNLRLSVDDDVEVAALGDVTLRARCEDYEPAGDPTTDEGIQLRLYATTAVPDAHLEGLDDLNSNNTGLLQPDTAPNAAELLRVAEEADPAATPPDPGVTVENPDQGVDSGAKFVGFVVSPSGDYLGVDGDATAVGIRALGADCALITVVDAIPAAG